MTRIVLIGQAPGRNGRRDALSGRPADKLSKLCGLTRSAFLRKFERRNVLARYPGKSGKGDAFPARKACAAALRMRSCLYNRRVIFLGRNVARAFGAGRKPLLRWFWHESFLAAVVPHPSGINLFYNDKRNRARVAGFLKGECGCT